MDRKEIIKYIKYSLGGRELNIAFEDKYRDAVWNYFTSRNYSDAQIYEIFNLISVNTERLRKTGIQKFSADEIEEYFYTDEIYEDQSKNYTKGIYEGNPTFHEILSDEPMYEDNIMKIRHIGTLNYDNNRDKIEKYRIVRFANGDRDASIFECYGNIDAILLADDKEYREAVEGQLNQFNIKVINCKGYVGTMRKNEETGKYQFEFSKPELTATMDFEEKNKEKGVDR